MAEITNAEAVRFSNERVRWVANRLTLAYYAAKSVKDEWTANDLGTLFPIADGPVVDGSATDGRHPIGGNEVTLVINRCVELVADYEGDGAAKLNTLLAVATETGM